MGGRKGGTSTDDDEHGGVGTCCCRRTRAYVPSRLSICLPSGPGRGAFIITTHVIRPSLNRAGCSPHSAQLGSHHSIRLISAPYLLLDLSNINVISNTLAAIRSNLKLKHRCNEKGHKRMNWGGERRAFGSKSSKVPVLHGLEELKEGSSRLPCYRSSFIAVSIFELLNVTPPLRGRRAMCENRTVSCKVQLKRERSNMTKRMPELPIICLTSLWK
ncbi:hypothetical protein SCHPADRAFT_38979 [Schizopora paradoxa]|uniref:Uncharacterized protein n=1 Tax=Schizopora paradoxa TaxID=27342 RepID=A0A0H2SRM5_9AGAM|nr:hypothetical protein SCHPADRAFT_38979 [Schizopora paradoxa]